MKQMLAVFMLVLVFCVFAQYSVGDEVLPADNISWTITGPSGNPEVGNSSDLFTKVLTDRKPVVIFCGQYW